MEKKDLEIFSVKTYKMFHDKIKMKTGNINKICNEVSTKNKAYHLKLNMDDNVILFGDIDHIENEERFLNIKSALCDYFDIEGVDYTKSIKENELSYHWSFNAYFTTVKNLKNHMLKFKKLHPEFNDNQIDTSIYKENSWFRLPNQTSEDKPFNHIIIEGEMESFIVNHIPENCDEIKILNDECIEINNTKEIENLLKCLSKNRCENYDDWMKVGLIINNELGINGSEIFNEWSKNSTKYNKDKVKTFYDNIKPKENGLKIGTLKKMAKEDNIELYKTLLKKDKKLIKDEKLEEMSKDNYIILKTQFEKNNFKVVNPIMFITIDKNNKIIIRSKKDFKDVYENLLYEKNIENELTSVSFINDWLKDPLMKTYNNLDFLPNNKNIPDDIYNTFDKYEAEKTNLVNTDIENSLIIKHIKNLCNNDNNVFDYVINFLSRKLKLPSKLTNTALIFKSSEGAGKDLFFNWFGNKIIGNDYYLNTEKSDLLFGKFTSCLENKIMIIVNETSGKDTFSINENIKNGITTEFNMIEHKGLKPYKNTNHIGYIFLTNNDNPLKVSADDRRFCGIECNNSICNNKEYFTELKKEMDSKVYDKAFYEYLLSIDSDEYDFTNNRPKTNFYSDLQELNKPALINFIENFLMENNDKDLIEIPSIQLYNKYNDYITNFNFKNCITITKFVLDMKKINGVSQKKTKKSRNIVLDTSIVKQFLIDKYKVEFSNEEEIESDDEDDD